MRMSLRETHTNCAGVLIRKSAQAPYTKGLGAFLYLLIEHEKGIEGHRMALGLPHFYPTTCRASSSFASDKLRLYTVCTYSNLS